MLRPLPEQYPQFYVELLRADLLRGVFDIDAVWLGVLANAVWRVGGVKNVTEAGVGFGSALAMAISFNVNHSVAWAILDGLFGWFYVLYYLL